MSNAVTGTLPTRGAIGLLLAAVATAVAPHVIHLPILALALVVAAGLWRWAVASRHWPLPGLGWRIVLTVAALAGVVATFGTVFGRDAGTALLIVMLGLKLLEVRTHRDAMLVLFLTYFLTVVIAFHSQEIAIVAIMVAALLLTTVALIELNRPPLPARTRRLPLRPAGVMMIQAVPLMILMFVLFPRLPAPLWGLSSDANAGVTGLSETMDPGSISRLATSDAVAFRAVFDGDTPPADDLYWRGPVFWHTDGRRWTQDDRRMQSAAAAPGFTPRGRAIAYSIMLEPSHQRWLFALDLPFTPPEGSALTGDLNLLAHRPVREPRRYAVTSYADYRTPATLPAQDRARGLQLAAANPRARALALAWRAQSASDAELVQRALDHFRLEPFHYTLTPPTLGNDPVDEFLFGTRSGFCEHYATAFTVLMRSAGVPARVVTGYQGGEVNPVDGHVVVRQRDAHAWAEVWLEEGGWMRVDPTAAVAPERISRGSGEALGPEHGGLRRFDGGMIGRILEHAGYGWDALNIRWNAWVLAFGPEAQAALLARLGLRGWLGMALALAGALLLALVALAIGMHLRGRRAEDPLPRLYRRFRAKLAGRGIVAAPAEGPIDFAARAGACRPDLAAAIDSITRLYVALRYGRLYSAGDLRRLRRAVAEFRP